MSNGEELLAWQMEQAGISFAREFRFHGKRQWRFDFVVERIARDELQRIAVEVEGGTWAQGRHTRGKGFEADAEKYNEAALLGWRILRVTPAMVEDGRALQWIERAIGRKA